MNKRSVVVSGRKTIVSLENAFWQRFEEIAEEKRLRVGELAGVVARQNPSVKLSSAIRVFVFDYFYKLRARKLDA